MTLRLVRLLMVMFWAGDVFGEETVRVLPTESVFNRELTKLRVTLAFPSVLTEDRYLNVDLRIDNVGGEDCEVPTILEPSEAVRIDWVDASGKGDRAYPAPDPRSGDAFMVLSPGSYVGSRILLGRSGWPCGHGDTSGCYWPAGKYEFAVTLKIPSTSSNVKLGIAGMTFKSDPAIAKVKSH